MRVRVVWALELEFVGIGLYHLPVPNTEVQGRFLEKKTHDLGTTLHCYVTYLSPEPGE